MAMGAVVMNSIREATVSSFIKSFNEHPSLTTFIVLALSVSSGYSVYAFAEKAELHAHIEISNTQFATINKRLDVIDYNFVVGRLEPEIFNLERIVEKGEARDLDVLRLKQLRSKLQAVHDERYRRENEHN